MKDYGYDASDYRTVDPMFGSNADFDQIIEVAHQRGLKVMVDMVLAHTSDQHLWFQESRQSRTNPKADWYVWADLEPDGTPPNNWMAVFGGPSWKMGIAPPPVLSSSLSGSPAQPQLAHPKSSTPCWGRWSSGWSTESMAAAGRYRHAAA
jgi:glycosidase